MRFVFLMGEQCVGKTTVADILSQHYGTPVLHIGRKLANSLGGREQAAGGENANADHPAQHDERVYDLITGFMTGAYVGSHGGGVIDGFPRSRSQAEVLQEWITTNKREHFEVMRLWAPTAIRRSRYRKRHAKNGVLPLSVSRRWDRREEGSDYYSVVKALRSLEVPVLDLYNGEGFTFNLTGFVPTSDIVGQSVTAGDDPIRMVADLHQLQSTDADVEQVWELSRKRDELRCLAPNTEWLARFVDHAIDELYEIKEEIPRKWWATKTGSVERARAELVDVLHFLFSAAWCLGLDWPDLMEVFRRKLDVNYSRVTGGDYDGTNRGDDAGIGTV